MTIENSWSFGDVSFSLIYLWMILFYIAESLFLNNPEDFHIYLYRTKLWSLKHHKSGCGFDCRKLDLALCYRENGYFEYEYFTNHLFLVACSKDTVSVKKNWIFDKLIVIKECLSEEGFCSSSKFCMQGEKRRLSAKWFRLIDSVYKEIFFSAKFLVHVWSFFD